MRHMNLFNDYFNVNMLDLKEHKISLSPGANASRPKYQITTPSGEVYFKFKMTDNEIGAEIFSFHIAKALDIPAAITQLATYKNEIGIASYDIGYFAEPDDVESYSIKDYLTISGFIDLDHFMLTVTSSFYVHTEYQQRHDMILQFLCENYKSDVSSFMQKVGYLKAIHDSALEEYNHQISNKLNQVLFRRIDYMHRKVREFYE